MNHERLADAAAVGAWTLWLSSHALAWMPVLQAFSLVVSIVASLTAIAYYSRRHSQ